MIPLVTILWFYSLGKTPKILIYDSYAYNDIKSQDILLI